MRRMIARIKFPLVIARRVLRLIGSLEHGIGREATKLLRNPCSYAAALRSCNASMLTNLAVQARPHDWRSHGRAVLVTRAAAYMCRL